MPSTGIIRDKHKAVKKVRSAVCNACTWCRCSFMPCATLAPTLYFKLISLCASHSHPCWLVASHACLFSKRTHVSVISVRGCVRFCLE